MVSKIDEIESLEDKHLEECERPFCSHCINIRVDRTRKRIFEQETRSYKPAPKNPKEES